MGRAQGLQWCPSRQPCMQSRRPRCKGVLLATAQRRRCWRGWTREALCSRGAFGLVAAPAPCCCTSAQAPEALTAWARGWLRQLPDVLWPWAWPA
eukprot:8713073-Lingulodinium_polyedra.AAC.1